MNKLDEFKIKDLPIMPQVATKILQLQEENLQISFRELERLIIVDPALTAKILKVANSAMYARPREITNLQQAITLLGFKNIKSLVLLVCASNLFGKSKVTKGMELYLWRHLITTAFLAKMIAVRLSREDIKEDVFIAGLLHDVGRIIMLLNNEEKYADLIGAIGSRKKNIVDRESEVFGYNHLEIGKAVLEQWNFPGELVDTAEQHHARNITSRYKEIVLIVALANLYERILQQENLTDEELELKGYYLESLNISKEDDEFYMTNIKEDIRKDDFFTGCTTLLG